MWVCVTNNHHQNIIIDNDEYIINFIKFHQFINCNVIKFKYAFAIDCRHIFDDDDCYELMIINIFLPLLLNKKNNHNNWYCIILSIETTKYGIVIRRCVVALKAHGHDHAILYDNHHLVRHTQWQRKHTDTQQKWETHIEQLEFVFGNIICLYFDW